MARIRSCEVQLPQSAACGSLQAPSRTTSKSSSKADLHNDSDRRRDTEFGKHVRSWDLDMDISDLSDLIYLDFRLIFDWWFHLETCGHFQHLPGLSQGKQIRKQIPTISAAERRQGRLNYCTDLAVWLTWSIMVSICQYASGLAVKWIIGVNCWTWRGWLRLQNLKSETSLYVVI